MLLTAEVTGIVLTHGALSSLLGSLLAAYTGRAFLLID